MAAGAPTGAVTVRPAAGDDAAALARAHVRAWQGGYAGLMPQEYLDGLDVHARIDGWRTWLAVPPEASVTLVGTVDDQVVGFTSFGAARDAESGEDGELYALNVDPAHWRAGVGSALLSAAHTGLAALGHGTATLWVLPGNVRARRVYEHHGWQVEEQQRTVELAGLTVAEVRYARSLR